MQEQQFFPSVGHQYDAIIVGAGIVGSECAWRCAQQGLDILLVTASLDTVGNFFSDTVALTAPQGSLMETIVGKQRTITITNWDYHRGVKRALEYQTGIHFLQSSVSNLLIEQDHTIEQNLTPHTSTRPHPSIQKSVQGISTWEGVNRYSDNVALCVGTFLQARLSLGALEEKAGRLSEMAYDDLYQGLIAQGFDFTTRVLEVTNPHTSYTVRYQQFAPSEWLTDTLELPRLRGLYAAGACVTEGNESEMASHGMRLANMLIEKKRAA